jgi:hypothetical protein
MKIEELTIIARKKGTYLQLLAIQLWLKMNVVSETKCNLPSSRKVHRIYFWRKEEIHSNFGTCRISKLRLE